MPRTLIDGHGRRITYVRISVTDRCNLRCVYCMPEDQTFRPLPHLLTREEIRRAAALLASFGVTKVRITGGEPTTRPDLVGIVRDLAAIGFPSGIALSTNGVLFPRMAHDLLAAGLTKVNISLDAAEAEHFRKMARRDHFKPVLESIDLALSLPFDSVKINAVVIRGFNDDQILPLAAMTREKKLGVRFIEFMPFGNNDWKDADWIGWHEVRDRLVAAGYELTLVEKDLVAGPADEYRVRGPLGEHRGTLGFITPVSDRFCDTCNRMRLTQDGFLKGCLFGHNDVDLLSPMRGGASEEELAAVVERAAAVKEERHPMFVGMRKNMLPLHARNMSEIGG
ncbi:MAG TPA: GTP 3',8-cyclase MoaA [Thermoanaerobaculia bacterium]|nr:GTP 3',8-cyclase MoaA [Thermoanaerobaculia bacterium]